MLYVILVGFLSSCAPAKRIPDGEYLYNRSRIELKNKDIDKPTLSKYQRIRPNKRILGVRFHLFVHNLANPEKDKFPHKWFRRIGEPPVVYDSNLVIQNAENFVKYISSKGYNKVTVDEEVVFRGKRANLKYNIDPGEPTLIRSLDYHFEDASIRKHIFADTAYAIVKVGQPFDQTKMQAERLRIEKIMKNSGYYNFSREYIFFNVFKDPNNPKVDVVLDIKQSIKGYVDPITKIRPHKQYKIETVKIYPDLQEKEEHKIPDTVVSGKYKVLYFGEQLLKPSTLIDANRLLPDNMYSLSSSDRTYVNYSTLDLFRFINVGFTEVGSEDEFGKLNCNIELAMRKRQSFSYELVATNSGYDFGVRGGVNYNNYNIFRGGEHLKLGFTGAIESLENRMDGAPPMREIGVNARFETPKFLLPFAGAEFQRKYSPRTALQLSYNNQRQHYYWRTIANASFGYTWRGNAYNKHKIYPVDFYLVEIPRMDDGYYSEYIEDTRLEASFIDHAILGMRYGFEFSSQSKERVRNYSYLKSNVEQAGFTVNAVNKASSWGEDSLLFQVPYFQYLRGDIDLRRFHVLSSRDRIACRFFAGVGYPYGNSSSMPFEKMYWAGGPYGMRAWQERSLGPGSYPTPDSVYNQLGDIKLEANIEYRFKMFWKLEGALFVDAGNIWLLEDSSTKPGAAFHFNSFLDDVAVGAGFGTRFDFTFVLIRLDFGFKIRDPAIQPDASVSYSGNEPYYTTGSKWTFKNPNVDIRDVSFQFGIGYPF